MLRSTFSILRKPLAARDSRRTGSRIPSRTRFAKATNLHRKTCRTLRNLVEQQARQMGDVLARNAADERSHASSIPHQRAVDECAGICDALPFTSPYEPFMVRNCSGSERAPRQPVEEAHNRWKGKDAQGQQIEFRSVQMCTIPEL